MIEELRNNIINWATFNIGSSFEFREHQLETIINICENILTGNFPTQVIEAPTGSGKSLLNIISAGVLADCYDMSSYILVSDLFLWQQYEDFINSNLSIKNKFGILKGQTGNYRCSKNNEDMRNADCRMANIKWNKLFNNDTANAMGYSCAKRCPYVMARKKAMQCKVVVMTYQLYHYMINIVSEQQSSNSFRPKDIIFCDECHNIPDIVTKCFTPELKLSDSEHFKRLYQYADDRDPELFDEDKYHLVNEYTSQEVMLNEYENVYSTLSNLQSDTKSVDDAISIYNTLVNTYKSTVECVEDSFAYKKQVNNEDFSKDEVQLYKSCSWFRNIMCLWNDFSMAVDEIGSEYVIRNVSESRLLGEDLVTFMCAKEDYIIYKFLLSTAKYRVMMSATIGGIDSFLENIGNKYLKEPVKFMQMPSTFDFSKSPIYVLNKFKMSYKERSKSLMSLKPIIYKICEVNFKDKKGLIQTGSYANAKEIYDNAPKELQSRFLLYNNSKEKSEMIIRHQNCKNTILIGPTLVDGIDLPGDQCRFIIILKVPYPVITDDFVKMKMQLFPKWYNSYTSNSIIQGIGRGNRFKDDYCTTYILDACFVALYNTTKNQYPKEIKDRMKFLG